jgi:hypothetical protein
MSVKNPNNNVTNTNHAVDNVVHPKYKNANSTITITALIDITGRILPLNIPSITYPLAIPPKHPSNGKNANNPVDLVMLNP